MAHDAGVETVFNGGCDVSITSVMQYLPIVRAYQSVDVLGHNFYKLQCYFVTHFIYVFSDWGYHRLRRELFSEEFNFIVANLKLVIQLQDAEIVGEFLQCLSILQVRLICRCSHGVMMMSILKTFCSLLQSRIRC